MRTRTYYEIKHVAEKIACAASSKMPLAVWIAEGGPYEHWVYYNNGDGIWACQRKIELTDAEFELVMQKQMEEMDEFEGVN